VNLTARLLLPGGCIDISPFVVNWGCTSPDGEGAWELGYAVDYLQRVGNEPAPKGKVRPGKAKVIRRRPRPSHPGGDCKSKPVFALPLKDPGRWPDYVEIARKAAAAVRKEALLAAASVTASGRSFPLIPRFKLEGIPQQPEDQQPEDLWSSFVFRVLAEAGRLESRGILDGKATLFWYEDDAFGASVAAINYLAARSPSGLQPPDSAPHVTANKTNPPPSKDGPDGFGRFKLGEWTFSELTPAESRILDRLRWAGAGKFVSVQKLDKALDTGSYRAGARRAGRPPSDDQGLVEDRVLRHKKKLEGKLFRQSEGAVSIRQKRNDNGILHLALAVHSGDETRDNSVP
jgi:hypothetical protein